MTLFGDQSKADLDRAVTLVEQAIRALGIDPEQARMRSADGPTRFRLQRGSAQILVLVQPPTAVQEDGILRVVAPVVRVPDEGSQTPLFRHLLELNAAALSGAAFGVLDDEVVLVSERSVRDLDASEVDVMIRTVGRDADRFDDQLAKLFNTKRSSD